MEKLSFEIIVFFILFKGDSIAGKNIHESK